MSWSYVLGNLATSAKDRIRLEIGDNIAGRTITLADEEITQNIATERNEWSAAARCCEQLARAFLSKADTRLGRSLMLTYTTQAQQFFAMAKELRKKAIGMNVPWVGGMTVADKVAYAENDLLVQPLFARDMQENPWVGGYTSDAPDADASEDGDSV